MARLFVRLIVFGIAVTVLVGCRPDLRIADHLISTDSGLYKIKLKVENAGKAKSGKTTIYVNAINPTPPEGHNEIRIQKSIPLPEIEAKATILTPTCSFTVQELTDKGVSIIRVHVDPKDLVEERHENNNTKQWNWP